MATYWPVPYSTYWAMLAALFAAALAVLVPAGRKPVVFLGGTLTLIVAGLWLQYMLTVLRNPQNPAAAAGYMKSNVARVELLPAVLVWLLTLAAAGAAMAAHPARGPGPHPHTLSTTSRTTSPTL